MLALGPVGLTLSAASFRSQTLQKCLSNALQFMSFFIDKILSLFEAVERKEGILRGAVSTYMPYICHPLAGPRWTVKMATKRRAKR